jgi:hypothetical protein
MNSPVMVILRWSDDAEAARANYERAVATWRERTGGRARRPAQVMAGQSERGGFVVVNLFASEEDHHAFHGIRELFSDGGQATPEIERIEVSSIWPRDATRELASEP